MAVKRKTTKKASKKGAKKAVQAAKTPAKMAEGVSEGADITGAVPGQKFQGEALQVIQRRNRRNA